MKKRSMLAVMSLAVGVAASLAAPSAHAGSIDNNSNGLHAVDHSSVLGESSYGHPTDAGGDHGSTHTYGSEH